MNEMNQAAKIWQIERELASLVETLVVLDKEVSTFIQRLSPVLSPEMSELVNEKLASQPLVALADAISIANSKARLIASALKNTMKRLEL